MHLSQNDLCQPGRVLNYIPKINKVGQLNLGGFIFNCSPAVCVMFLPAKQSGRTTSALCELNTIIFPLRAGGHFVLETFISHTLMHTACSRLSLYINYTLFFLAGGYQRQTSVSHYSSFSALSKMMGVKHSVTALSPDIVCCQ